jgi:cellulose synthase/poly-beta-1,6-N-acetylglucosamine synthase-like glycosyltransferase
MEEPFISVVIPARNVGGIIGNCLESLKELDYPKDRMEIIVADGLSTDRTKEIAESYGAHVIVNPRIRVVSARNVGFEAAQGELIAFSDADCVMDENWLKNCPKYFQDETVAGVGGPNLVPQGESNFGKAVGLIFDYAFFVTRAAPTMVFDKVIESRAFGSNAVYRADVLRKVMPVDESMIEGEDVAMNRLIKDLGYRLLYVPDVIVYHSRRSTPKRWWRQMYNYGLGRVLLHKRRIESLKPAHVAAGLTIPILLAICAVLVAIDPWFLLYALGAAFVLAILSGIFALVQTRSWGVALNMPIALAIFLIAWSCGFLHEFVMPTPER